MRAVRLHATGEALRLDEVVRPEPSGTEVRVRVAGAGVCRTDLHIVDGIQERVQLPRTLGHEIAGTIDAAGPDAELGRHHLAIGDAVVVYGGWGCGTCAECRAGVEQRCERSVAPGFQADGGYAEAMLVPDARHLVALGSLDPGHAAPLGDAGMTALRAVRRADPWLAEDARVLVIGAGGVGQFVLQLLRLVPAAGRSLHVAVRDLEPSRLERAGALGADLGLLADDPGFVLDGIGARPNVVIDVVGSEDTLALAAAAVAPGGAVILVGEAGGTHPFGFASPSIEAWMTTVAWGAPADLRDVVALARAHRLTWEVETMPLDAAAAAHDRLRAGHVTGRLVLVP